MDIYIDLSEEFVEENWNEDWAKDIYNGLITYKNEEPIGEYYTEGLKFEFENKTYIVYDYIGTDTDVIIPSTYNGYEVTKINSNAFLNCEHIKTVSIPETIVTIDSDAFGSCTSLESIYIPKNVEYIGIRAFSSCVSLKEVIFENNSKLSVIEYGAFLNCTSLEKFTIPRSVKKLGGNLFSSYTGLNSNIKLVKIEKGSLLEDVSINAFYAWPTLTVFFEDEEHPMKSKVDHFPHTPMYFGAKYYKTYNGITYILVNGGLVVTNID